MRYLHAILFFVAVPMIGTADSVIALWDFGPDEAGYSNEVTVNNTIGTPTLTGMEAGTSYVDAGYKGISFTDADGAFHTDGQALAWGSGVNDENQEWILELDLTGFSGINIRWDYRSSGTGPSSARLDYRLDGETWVSIDTLDLNNDANFHVYEKELASITAIDNHAAVEFRLSGFAGGEGSGTHRIDNLQIAAIPEPAVISLVLLFGSSLLVTRRILG